MDEAHIIYVNARRQDDTELGRLMHDLHCKNAKDMYSKVLADRIHELKETKMGVEFMCYEMEKIYSEGIEKGIAKGIGQGIEQGIEQGELKKARETALSLVEMGLRLKRLRKQSGSVWRKFRNG